MKAFNSNKPLYFLLCCINVTLLLLIFLATSKPPYSRSLQQGNSIALHIESMQPGEAGEILSKQGVDHHKQAMLLPSSLIRKMASSLVNMDVFHQYRLDQELYHGNHIAVPRRLPKSIAARRSLLHLSEGHQELSTASVALNKANGVPVAKTSAHVPHDHLPSHDVDVSATFHVDYSGPKTHPPKNN